MAHSASIASLRIGHGAERIAFWGSCALHFIVYSLGFALCRMLYPDSKYSSMTKKVHQPKRSGNYRFQDNVFGVSNFLFSKERLRRQLIDTGYWITRLPTPGSHRGYDARTQGNGGQEC